MAVAELLALALLVAHPAVVDPAVRLVDPLALLAAVPEEGAAPWPLVTLTRA